MSSTHRPVEKDAMKAAFPPAPPVHIGEPTAHTLVTVFRHLMRCSQTTPFDMSTVQFLFVIVPRWLYPTFTAEGYPMTWPASPGAHPNYTNEDTAAEREVKKLTWELANKRHRDTITMSACLIERLLECFEMPLRQAFENKLLSNPNMEVQRAFQWFLENYGFTNKYDRENNKIDMKKAWNIQDGWHTLENQIEEGLLYASFGQAPISDNDVCDIAIRLILDTGLFANEYTEWTVQTTNNKTWLAMKTFWPPKI